MIPQQCQHFFFLLANLWVLLFSGNSLDIDGAGSFKSTYKIIRQVYINKTSVYYGESRKSQSEVRERKKVNVVTVYYLATKGWKIE